MQAGPFDIPSAPFIFPNKHPMPPLLPPFLPFPRVKRLYPPPSPRLIRPCTISSIFLSGPPSLTFPSWVYSKRNSQQRTFLPPKLPLPGVFRTISIALNYLFSYRYHNAGVVPCIAEAPLNKFLTHFLSFFPP